MLFGSKTVKPVFGQRQVSMQESDDVGVAARGRLVCRNLTMSMWLGLVWQVPRFGQVVVASAAARAGGCCEAMWLVRGLRNAKIFASTGILRPADVHSAVGWACANE